MGECKRCTRACVDCGKTMHDVYPTKLRCPECASRHHKELSARWRERNRIIGRRPESPQKRIQNAEQRQTAGRLIISGSLTDSTCCRKCRQAKGPPANLPPTGPGNDGFCTTHHHKNNIKQEVLQVALLRIYNVEQEPPALVSQQPFPVASDAIVIADELAKRKLERLYRVFDADMNVVYAR